MRYNYRHDRISALAALTVSPQRHRLGLYVRFQQQNFKALQVANFLRLLLRQLRGPVVLLWDNGPIHKGPLFGALRRDFPRLHVEWFPGYTPELNPVEHVWQDFKSHTANTLYRDRSHLRKDLQANRKRARRSQAKLRSFILASDLPSAPWR